jgi:hypothetical protein
VNCILERKTKRHAVLEILFRHPEFLAVDIQVPWISGHLHNGFAGVLEIIGGDTDFSFERASDNRRADCLASESGLWRGISDGVRSYVAMRFIPAASMMDAIS